MGTMICGRCGLAGIRWEGLSGPSPFTVCPHCGGRNCQQPEADPHDEGRTAFFDGFPLRDCPYEGDDAAEWEGGWMEAEEESI